MNSSTSWRWNSCLYVFYPKEAIPCVVVVGQFLLEGEAKTDWFMGEGAWGLREPWQVYFPWRERMCFYLGVTCEPGRVTPLVMTLLWVPHLPTGTLYTCLGPKNSESMSAPQRSKILVSLLKESASVVPIDFLGIVGLQPTVSFSFLRWQSGYQFSVSPNCKKYISKLWQSLP